MTGERRRGGMPRPAWPASRPNAHRAPASRRSTVTSDRLRSAIPSKAPVEPRGLRLHRHFRPPTPRTTRRNRLLNNGVGWDAATRCRADGEGPGCRDARRTRREDAAARAHPRPAKHPPRRRPAPAPRETPHETPHETPPRPAPRDTPRETPRPAPRETPRGTPCTPRPGHAALRAPRPHRETPPRQHPGHAAPRAPGTRGTPSTRRTRHPTDTRPPCTPRRAPTAART